MRIVFMGTPEIAAYCLEQLYNNDFEIVAVVTAPDKPAGRGRKPKQSEVKRFALGHNLKILQPQKLKDSEFIETLASLNIDLGIVVAFRMLPKIVWQIPRYGTINLHASLLPEYRGAAPINWAIINGETKTGVTTFFIDEKIDTGKIILQKEIEIEKTDTAGTLHDKIMVQGADLLIETIKRIEKGNFSTIEQNKLLANENIQKKAPKIFKDDCQIKWDNEGETIYNFIRGLSPFPGAWSIFKNDKKEIIVKIFFAKFQEQKHSYKTGEIIGDKKLLKVAVRNGFMIIDTLRPEGKKTISGEEFVRGYDLKNAYFI